MRLLPPPSSRCPWPDRRGLAKAEGPKTARLELFGIALLMEDPLTGGSGGGDGVLTSVMCELATGRMEELAAGEGG